MIVLTCCRFRRLPLLLAALLIPAAPSWAYLHASLAGDLVGKLESVTTVETDTFIVLARVHSLGLNELELANPHVDKWLPGQGAHVLLPKRFVLPEGRRQGIVLNIPEMRLYYFRRYGKTEEVYTFPVGVGRAGWTIPYRRGSVISKHVNPPWYPPESIRLEREQEGEPPLPSVVLPGPDNPLGTHALRLSLPGYLIHGTNRSAGIGMRVSHGCIRLYPEEIRDLFSLVPVGTAVSVINQPVKLGIDDGVIYLEAHPPQAEDGLSASDMEHMVSERLYRRLGGAHYVVDWDLIKHAISRPNGVPLAVGLLLT